MAHAIGRNDRLIRRYNKEFTTRERRTNRSLVGQRTHLIGYHNNTALTRRGCQLGGALADLDGARCGLDNDEHHVKLPVPEAREGADSGFEVGHDHRRRSINESEQLLG
jgi:hypothetical protein